MLTVWAIGFVVITLIQMLLVWAGGERASFGRATFLLIWAALWPVTVPLGFLLGLLAAHLASKARARSGGGR